MLEDLGLVVTSAANGAEAVRAVQDGIFTLVLMDCHMPVMDGFDADPGDPRAGTDQGCPAAIADRGLDGQRRKGVREACTPIAGWIAI